MAEKIRVLYVDDEPGLLDIGKVFLEQSGDFVVTTATNAQDALLLLEQEQFDTIISDYMMPGMDGIQFLVEVRKRFGAVPFILFTGKGREEVVIQAINSGADFYLQKGGNPSAQFAELIHKIKSAASSKRAADLLRESEEKYQVIVDHALEAIMIIDSSANVLFANPAAATLVDIDNSSACIGKNALEIIAPESREAALADFTSTMEGRDGYLAQYKIITATAQERWVELIGKKISFGGVPAVIVMFRDVTERKRADEALRESENRYRTLAESSTDDIFIIGRDDTVRFVNSHAAGNLHLPAAEVIGKPRKNFFPPDIAEKQGTYLQEVFETGEPFHEDGKILYGNQEFWQNTSLVPLKDETGTVVAVLGVSRDITERKVAEEALNESERRFRELSDLLPQTVYETDANGILTYANHIAFEWFGYTEDEFKKGLNVLQMIAPHDRERAGAAFRAIIEGTGRTRVSDEYQALQKNGGTFPISIFASPVIVHGRINGHRGIIIDNTERKRVEEALRDSKNRFSNLVAQSPLSIQILDISGKTILVNRAFEELWEVPAEQVLGYNLLPDDQSRDTGINSYLEKAFSGDSVVCPPIEFTPKTESVLGRTRVVQAFIYPIKDESGAIREVTLVHMDITDRKQAEEALAESEQKFHDIFNTTTDSIHICEIKEDSSPGRFIEINEVCLQMLGYSREEMLTKTPFDITTDYFNPPLENILKEQLTTSTSMFETEHRRKDGSTVPVEINSHVVTIQGKKVLLGVARDITERKRAEGTLLKVNQKLNILSQLTRKDLTNQLFVLSSYLELAKNRLAGQGSIIEILRGVDDAVRLIHETIEYSKDYQDMGAKPPKWQNVKMALLLGLSHVSIGNIRHSIETENLEIFADPLLEKVCQRFFENSVKHGGHVTLVRVWHTVTPGGVNLVFEDDGSGIPQEKKEQIFSRDEGTGRASMRSLIFVREILDITGITIRETGEPGKGARFEMTVPKGAWRMAGKGD
jgi:PAS domain S-box-containing protein